MALAVEHDNHHIPDVHALALGHQIERLTQRAVEPEQVRDLRPTGARMASPAAWSAPSLSPRPTILAAARAAASVPRTSSRARLRSGRAAARSSPAEGISSAFGPACRSLTGPLAAFGGERSPAH